MPYINVRILGGATVAQKRAVVADLTTSMIERLGKSPGHIHIVIDEVAPENWGFAGHLTKDLPAARVRAKATVWRKRVARAAGA